VCSFLTQIKRVLLNESVVFVSCLVVMLDTLMFGMVISIYLHLLGRFRRRQSVACVST
jgi:hypothetical protein